jgi:hypothetical protein
MSIITKEGRLSAEPPEDVPALLDLPEIRHLPETQHTPASASNVLSSRGLRADSSGVNLAEGCFVTKSCKYTHQLTRWIVATRKEDSSVVVSRNFIGLAPATDSLTM